MEVFRDDARKILLLTPVPFEGEIQCIACSIKPPIEPKSLFQWKVLKCRMLLFTEMRIIASPSEGFENEIWVLMSKTYYETGEIHSHLNRIGLTVEKRIQTTKSVYEACLRYTLIARIAPLWNQIASFLVCGRNFLLQKEPLLAVALDVFMLGKEMSIAIWPHRIHMYGVPLQDLLEEKEEMINILPEIVIDEGRWVHVLPSLKKAQVLSVSKRIPNHCRFLSYKQLKRHWKNNYGYRLPEEENEIPFYVTVSFGSNKPILGSKGWSGSVYIYPSLCICPCPPVVLGCTNQALPLKIFLEDLSNRMPQVCDLPFAGNQVEFGYAVPKLHYANENSLSVKPSMMKLNLKDLMPYTDIFKGSKPIALSNQRVFIQSSFPSAELVEAKSWGRTVLKNSSQDVDIKENLTGIAASIVEPNTEQETEKKEQARFAPVFKSKMKINTHMKQAGRQADRILLSSLTKATSKSSQNSQNQGNIIVEKREFEVAKLMKNSIMINDEKLEVKSKGTNQPLKPLSSEVFKRKEREERIFHKDDKAKTSLIFGQKILQPSSTSFTNISPPTSKVLLKSNDLCNQQGTYCIASTRLSVNDQAWNTGLKQNNYTSNFMLDNSSVKQSNDRPSQYFPVKPINVGTATVSSESLVKVKNTDESINTVKNKKPTPRSRPTVQEHLDVESLAKGGMLCKANTTTIISWLRDRGVSCRVKDKKCNLIHLVEKYLGLPSLNQTNLSQSTSNTHGQ